MGKMAEAAAKTSRWNTVCRCCAGSSAKPNQQAEQARVLEETLGKFMVAINGLRLRLFHLMASIRTSAKALRKGSSRSGLVISMRCLDGLSSGFGPRMAAHNRGAATESAALRASTHPAVTITETASTAFAARAALKPAHHRRLATLRRPAVRKPRHCSHSGHALAIQIRTGSAYSIDRQALIRWSSRQRDRPRPLTIDGVKPARDQPLGSGPDRLTQKSAQA